MVTLKNCWLIWFLGIPIFSISITKSYIYVPEAKNYAQVLSIVEKYKRPITVLEIGLTSTSYTFSIASQCPQSVCIMLLLGEGEKEIANSIRGHNYNNIVLLNPNKITYQMFETLGRCEHFDIVIVQDISDAIKYNTQEFVNALLKLGDNIFLEVKGRSRGLLNIIKSKKIPIVAKHSKAKLALHSTEKNGLDIARWTQRLPPSPIPRYHINSTFEEKTFFKDSLDKPIAWIAGVNLVTFVMLGGTYPTDRMIRKKLLEISRAMPYHNDFLIGNIIIQGNKLAPIDFSDKRRNADMSKCLKQALKFFNSTKERLINPQKSINKYYDKV